MALDYSVHFQALNRFRSVPKLRHQRALLTFVPTGGLVAGFTERSIRVTQSNWKTELRARGGVETDLLWIAVEKFFAPALAAPGPDNANPARAKHVSDYLVLGRRTAAEPTVWTVTVTGFIDGTYTLEGVGFDDVSHVAAGAADATEIRDALLAAWNANLTLNGPTLAATSGAAALTITTDTDGFPFIVGGSSTGSPLTIVNTTAAGVYSTDLAAIRLNDDPTGKLGGFYFIHDLQWDDATNEQGVDWCIAEKTADERKTYLYIGQSYNADIPDAAETGDPASELKTLLTPLSDENNDRGSLWFHDQWQFEVCTLLGRCIGYNLGQINYAQRQLVGITPADLGSGNDEVTATSKFFNFYSSEFPNGNTKWGYLGSGRFIDELWGEDILSYEGQTALSELLTQADALAYTDDGGIAQGQAAITAKISKYSGPTYGYLIPDSIVVTAGKRADQPTNDIVERLFTDYQVTAQGANLINRYGAEARPISLTISI